MTKVLSVRERLLKRSEVVSKIEVRLDKETVLEVHEIKPERIEALRGYCKKDGEVDLVRLRALMIVESVHADGERLIDQHTKEALDTMDDIEVVNKLFKSGEQQRLYEAISEAMGYGDPDEEVEELKN